MADEKEKKTTSKKVAEKKETEKTKTAAKKPAAKKETVTKKEETKKTETKVAAKEVKEQKETVKVEKKAEKVAEVEELSAKATVKYARISSRKVAIVANLIRGKNVDEALAILKFTPRGAAEIIAKVVKSAKANAENNHEMDADKLYVASIVANQGPTMKRFMPRAMGRATMIRKRTSHIEVVLKERK